ncbi:DUF3052 family protein [Parasphingopyxis lamellibrachiae]|uniref:DUF3052 family protein n=1 Tax=Parasphingopyxis lamellibrachiae TaxID=680125 RepID=A0A3D9FHA2_9SPHN|nr:DUF3052 family protein [Parasphingopyxis lamellibrachiae]RED16466.1 hypothetical protein DFR46_1489 [Parasphingopyxis lamellibrachiae]
MPAGYSGTPLAKKLGFGDGATVWQRGVPDSVRATIDGQADVIWEAGDIRSPVAAHIFATERAEMEELLRVLRSNMAQHGFVWMSWPKKASKVPTDITEDVIRTVALPMGFVDIKVCAVDEIWSGLKLVIRKELRR